VVMHIENSDGHPLSVPGQLALAFSAEKRVAGSA